MNKTTRAVMAVAAMTGLVTGLVGCYSSSDGSGAKATKADNSKHDCKGMNACKGLGGCKTGENGCKGKNTCKGKGGCKVG